MANIYPHSLPLLILLIILTNCKVNSTATDTASASPEEDVKFPCFNSTVMNPNSCFRVKLLKYQTNASQKKILFAWPKKFQDVNRVKWKAGENGEKSLYLTSVQKSDEGLYSCEVCHGWECTLVKNISLKVKDCKTITTLKAAPSTTIKLKCPVNQTSGSQNVTWTMLKGGNPVNIKLKRVEKNDTSLVIASVNASDSGWYRCQYMFEQMTRCFDINLLVQEVENVVRTTVPVITTQQEIVEEEAKEESGGATVAVAVPVVTGIVIIAAVIGLLLYRRHNTLRFVQQNQSHPADAVRQSSAFYEVVNLTTTQDHSNQVNMLYQDFENESLRTFHCK